VYPILWVQSERAQRDILTYMNLEPASAMTTADVLIRLTILSEVHVEMILHFFLANEVIRKADATLFTLDRQSIV